MSLDNFVPTFLRSVSSSGRDRLKAPEGTQDRMVKITPVFLCHPVVKRILFYTRGRALSGPVLDMGKDVLHHSFPIKHLLLRVDRKQHLQQLAA